MNFCLTQNYPVQYKINFTNLACQKCLLIITESHGLTSNEGKGSNTVHLASMKKRILKQQEFLLKKGHFKEEKKNSKITLTSSIMNSGGQELHSVPEETNQSDTEGNTFRNDGTVVEDNNATKISDSDISFNVV